MKKHNQIHTLGAPRYAVRQVLIFF